MCMMTYAIPGLVYDDESPLTFEADDGEASTINFDKLIGLGWGNAEFQRDLRQTDRIEPEVYESSDPDGRTLHRWAWNFARHQLTNYDELVCEFSRAGEEWDLCEACQAKADSPDGDGYGLDIGCDDCEGNMDAARESADVDIELLKLGVAAWVKTRWPQLEIDEDRSANGGDGGCDDEDLAEAVKDLRVVPPSTSSSEARGYCRVGV